MFLRLGLLLALAAGLPAVGMGGEDRVRLEGRLEAARKAMDSGELLEAGRELRMGLAVARAEGDQSRALDLLLEIGELQRRAGDWALALRSFLEVLDTPNTPPETRARAHTGVGGVMSQAGDHEAAYRHYRAARDLAHDLNDRRLFVEASVGVATARRDLGEALLAGGEMTEAVAAAEQLGDPALLATAINSLGVLVGDTGRHEEAIALHARARAIAEEHNLPYQRTHALYHRGKNLRRLHDPSAGAVLETAYAEAQAIGELRLQRWTSWELSRWWEEEGDPVRALQWQRRYEQHRTAMERQAGAGRLSELEWQHRLSQQERQLEAERRAAEEVARSLAEAERERRRWTGLTVAGLISLVSIGFGLLANRRAQTRILEETRRGRDEAVRADTRKSELVRAASHDLKNPLGNILLAVEALRSTPLDPMGVELADMLEGEGRRMQALIRDLLDHAALEVGRLELRIEPVDIAAIARETLSTFRNRAHEKRQTLQLDGSSVVVEADRDRLRQVLENLVSNALKFSPPDTTVRVWTGPLPNGGSRISVRDEGPGIAAAERDRLFAPFRRLSASPTAGESSSGLGLAIVHQLVQLHGGRAHVEAGTGGRGSTFVVDLPKRPPVPGGTGVGSGDGGISSGPAPQAPAGSAPPEIAEAVSADRDR